MDCPARRLLWSLPLKLQPMFLKPLWLWPPLSQLWFPPLSQPNLLEPPRVLPNPWCRLPLSQHPWPRVNPSLIKMLVLWLTKSPRWSWDVSSSRQSFVRMLLGMRMVKGRKMRGSSRMSSMQKMTKGWEVGRNPGEKPRPRLRPRLRPRRRPRRRSKRRPQRESGQQGQSEGQSKGSCSKGWIEGRWGGGGWEGGGASP